MQHKTYRVVVRLVRSGRLKEPFTPEELAKKAPRGSNRDTFRRFPAKHRKGNGTGDSQLFVRLKDNKYRVLRPFRYDL